MSYRRELFKVNTFTTKQQIFAEANEFTDVFTMVHQISNCYIQAVMNNLMFIILDYLAAKKMWDFGLMQRFCDWSLKQLLHLEGNARQTSYRVQYAQG